MSHQKIAVLVVALLCLLAFSQLVNHDEATSSEKVLPELAANLSTVTELNIQSLADGSSLTLVQSGNDWLISEKSSYPADFEQLVTFLNTLSEMTIAETKTARSENHGRLGLADSGDQAGIRVTVVAEKSHIVVFGDDAENRGMYLRRDGEDQVYLSDQDIELSTAPMDWVDPVVIDVESSRVASVRLETTEGALSAQRETGSDQLVLLDVPDGRVLRYETIVDGLARLLVNLRFTDVAPLVESNFEDASLATVTLVDGTEIRVQSVQLGDRFWLHLDTQSSDTKSNTGWQYEVAPFNYNEFNKSMEDMLEAKVED